MNLVEINWWPVLALSIILIGGLTTVLTKDKGANAFLGALLADGCLLIVWILIRVYGCLM